MPSRITDLTDPGWRRLFTDLRSSWFRLETLQSYAVDYENDSYRQFRRTGRVDLEPDGWQQMITDHVRARRTLQRVHVVLEPLSEYVRYEMASFYSLNGRAGEDIRILPVGKRWPDDLPERYDYWLFDDADLWEMEYDHGGAFIAARRVDDAEQIDQCRRWRDRAVTRSVGLQEYSYRSPTS